VGLGTPSPAVVDHSLFRFVTALEIRKASRLQYPICVLTIQFGPGAGDLRRTGESIRRLVRCTDLIAYQASGTGLQLLLIDAAPHDADVVIARLKEDLPRAEALDYRVRSYPSTASSIEELLIEREGSP